MYGKIKRMKTFCGVILGLLLFASCNTSKNSVAVSDLYQAEYAKNIEEYNQNVKPEIYDNSGKELIWVKGNTIYSGVKEVEKIR